MQKCDFFDEIRARVMRGARLGQKISSETLSTGIDSLAGDVYCIVSRYTTD